jgi:hypothetical protein
MPLDLHLASVSVSYTFDFGVTRRELEGLRAEVDHQQYELEAARLMLAGNVVTTAIREASLREQIAESEEIVALQARELAIAERMEALGGVARVDIVARQRDLAQARAALPDLRRDMQRMRHRLALYVGMPPSAPELPEFRLAELQLPAELPLSLPSQLARQRPDIRSAEALLARAGAQVGVATANLYPQLTLSAQLGALATSPGDLFAGGNGFSLLGASLFYPCSAAASCRPGVARPSRPTSRPARPTGRRCCRRCRTSPTCCARSKPMPPGSRSAATRRAGPALSRHHRAAAGGRRRQPGRRARSDAASPSRDDRAVAGQPPTAMPTRPRSCRRLAAAGGRRPGRRPSQVPCRDPDFGRS